MGRRTQIVWLDIHIEPGELPPLPRMIPVRAPVSPGGPLKKRLRRDFPEAKI